MVSEVNKNRRIRTKHMIMSQYLTDECTRFQENLPHFTRDEVGPLVIPLLFKNTPIHHKKSYNWNRESESILNIL